MSFIKSTFSPSFTASNAACRSSYLPNMVPSLFVTCATVELAACACEIPHGGDAANTSATAAKT
jgi:hypothetical protein